MHPGSEPIYQKLAAVEASGQPCVLCTIINSRGSTPRRVGSKMLFFPDGTIMGTVGGGELEARVIQTAQQTLKTGQPETLQFSMVDPARGDPGVCGGTVAVFIEPVFPRPTLVVVGMGHVGKAVAHLGGWLGFRVVVSDDRPEFCTPDVAPGADEYLPVSLAEIPNLLAITPHTFLVLTTRNAGVDIAGLPALLQTSAAFIGVIGSRRRWATTTAALLEQGIGKDQLDRIFSPVGLELNAETPEEIAVSILAQIIQIQRGGTGRVMRQQGGV